MNRSDEVLLERPKSRGATGVHSDGELRISARTIVPKIDRKGAALPEWVREAKCGSGAVTGERRPIAL